MTDTELTSMLRDIAHTQAKLYYKVEEKDPPVVVVKSVFMLILAVISIQFTRAGVDEERLNSIDGIPEEVANEMRLVGWNLEGVAQVFNMD